MTANKCAQSERQLRPMLVAGAIAVNVLVLTLVVRAFLGDGQPAVPAASTTHRAAVVAGSHAGRMPAPTGSTFARSTDVAAELGGQTRTDAPAMNGVVVATVVPPAANRAGMTAPSAVQAGEARKVRYMTASDYRLSGSAPTLAELNARAEQVTYEADRRLALLTAMYKLTPAQQALVYPIVARASQAYDPALSIDGEAATDAYLDAINPSASASAGASDASAYAGTPVASSSGADAPASSAAVSAEYARRRTGVPMVVAAPTTAGNSGATAPTASDASSPVDGGTAASVPATASTSSDGYDAALASSLETVEAELSPFLDNDQLATMSDEQVDRYYWWAEILGNLSGTTTDPAASETAAATTQPEDGTSSTAEGDTGEPSAYQGGNLLDLLNP